MQKMAIYLTMLRCGKPFRSSLFRKKWWVVKGIPFKAAIPLKAVGNGL